MIAKILILLPTINEVGHIFRLYKKILFQKLNTDFLFIDACYIKFQFLIYDILRH